MTETSEIQWSFSQLHTRLFSLYEAGEYAAALALVERHQERFPDQTANFIYWRMCMLGCLNRSTEALDALTQALADGYWWAPETLRTDPDLAALLENPVFLSALETCGQKMQAANAVSQPRLKLLLPSNQPEGKKLPLLICLHGRGSTEDSFASHWAPAAKRGWIVALAGSSQMLASDSYGWEEYERSRQEIQQLYAAVGTQHPVDEQRVVMTGFSQGGGLAIRLALTGAVNARGFIAVAPAVRDPSWLEPALAALPAGREVRAVLLAGETDIRWAKAAREVAALCEQRRLPCRLQVYPGLGHDFPPDFQQRFADDLAFITT